ncbi:hypothetical protein [Amycolatopsis rifamycinica]|uniref:Uncharacterized protein n=1 Tax=Amycolatopsis rifamycinica TaxID=287986 RepID=A0A066UAN0_9PSEU|nr:hypothetical protein [Amycolatopsis rifamycinica]KDN24155.1 hypothetical protein DV20_00235 [Amycolatopsis rifamycinica]
MRYTDDDPEEPSSVPTSEAEHDRIRGEVAPARWFVARDELPFPVAVVRDIPAVAEAYTRNLRWEPVPPGLELEAVAGEQEAADLLFALATGVRAARRTEGPEYFGFSRNLRPFVDVELVFTVVRRHNGGEEVCVRDGLWIPSKQLRGPYRGVGSFDRSLPLSAEEVEQVTARLSRPRSFLVDDGHDVPRAVVHLDGETERVFGRGLEWKTASLLEEVADHPDWTVTEVAPAQETFEAYQLAQRIRRFKQRQEWGSDAWYFGIYDTLEATLDVDATRLLVKTEAGDKWFGELYVGQGRWQPTRKLDDIWRGLRDDPQLALSPAEAQRIMHRLG